MLRGNVDAAQTLDAASNDFPGVTPERIDLLVSELHLVAERLRDQAGFRSALVRASVEEEDNSVEYPHA